MKVELEYTFGTVILDLDLEEEVNEWLYSMAENDYTEEERQAHLKSLEREYLFCVLTPSDLLNINEFMDFLKDKHEQECRELLR